MEALPTLMELLTADLLIPLLPSLVTMATLSLEGVSELVRLMGPGVEQLKHVSVSSYSVLMVVRLSPQPPVLTSLYQPMG